MSDEPNLRAEALQAAVHLAANGNPLNAYTANDIVSHADLFHAFLQVADVVVTGAEPEFPF